MVVLHDGDSDTDKDTDEAEAEKVNVHAAHQQEAWAAIRGYEGEEVKAPWQKASKKLDQVWKVVRENVLDEFPSMPGPPGTERNRNAQTKVLIGYTVASRPDEILGV